MRRAPLGTLVATLVLAAGSAITWRQARGDWPFGCRCCVCEGAGGDGG